MRGSISGACSECGGARHEFRHRNPCRAHPPLDEPSGRGANGPSEAGRRGVVSRRAGAAQDADQHAASPGSRTGPRTCVERGWRPLGDSAALPRAVTDSDGGRLAARGVGAPQRGVAAVWRACPGPPECSCSCRRSCAGNGRCRERPKGRAPARDAHRPTRRCARNGANVAHSHRGRRAAPPSGEAVATEQFVGGNEAFGQQERSDAVVPRVQVLELGGVGVAVGFSVAPCRSRGGRRPVAGNGSLGAGAISRTARRDVAVYLRRIHREVSGSLAARCVAGTVRQRHAHAVGFYSSTDSLARPLCLCSGFPARKTTPTRIDYLDVPPLVAQEWAHAFGQRLAPIEDRNTTDRNEIQQP